MASDKLGEYERLQEEGRYSLKADIPTITFSEIGKRGIRRLDGYEKASGKAIYTRDMQLPGMLYGRVLMSPYARARILRMDTSKAETLPGVRSIIRYDDPEVKGRQLNGSYFAPGWVSRELKRSGLVEDELEGWGLKPVRPVLGDEAWFEGQPLGVAVAAESEDIANEALRLVDIDWEEITSQYTGDAIAFQLGKSARGLRRWGRNAAGALMDDLRDYLQIEGRQLPLPAEVDAFNRAVDEVRASTERFELRVQRLQSRLMTAADTNQ